MTNPRQPMLIPLDPEKVAYWYFRLNGCFTITNFLLHLPDASGNVYSDGDILAIRFPYRVELDDSKRGAMQDDTIFTEQPAGSKLNYYVVEVKYWDGEAVLNNSWRRNDNVLREIVKRTGLIAPADLPNVVSQLFQYWRYENDSILIRVLAVAKRFPSIPRDEMPLPLSQQLTWEGNILPFIHRRLRDYQQYKTNHPQWDETAKALYTAAIEADTTVDFVQEVVRQMDEFKANNKKSKRTLYTE